MVAYYNEIDPYAAQWLRNLIAAGHIAPGDVDERSIEDVQPEDLEGYTQCHFFAGIGGWSLALRLAGWPDDRPVWTGSPPCQPFSVSGKQEGYDDDRHLAPKWLDLVSKRLPAAIYGEQVAAAFSSKKWAWLDDLQDALERENYAAGAVVLPACGVGSPHIRQRGWIAARWLGDSGDPGLERHSRDGDHIGESGREYPQPGRSASPGGAVGRVAHGNSDGRCEAWQRGAPSRDDGSERDGPTGRMADDGSKQPQQPAWEGAVPGEEQGRGPHGQSAGCGALPRTRYARTLHSFWSDADWLFCRDGRWRPVESGTFPLADGVPGRVGRLRAYGNAIVPQEAALIISATMQE